VTGRGGSRQLQRASGGQALWLLLRGGGGMGGGGVSGGGAGGGEGGARVEGDGAGSGEGMSEGGGGLGGAGDWCVVEDWRFPRLGGRGPGRDASAEGSEAIEAECRARIPGWTTQRGGFGEDTAEGGGRGAGRYGEGGEARGEDWHAGVPTTRIPRPSILIPRQRGGGETARCAGRVSPTFRVK